VITGNPIAASELELDMGHCGRGCREHANHLLNHRGVRYASEDRIRDPHDVTIMSGWCAAFIAATSREVERVVALLHKRQKVCRPADILGHRGHEPSFSWSVMCRFTAEVAVVTPL